MDWSFIRKQELVDNVIPEGGWLWPASDSGLWEGPKNDWEQYKSIILSRVQKFDVVVQAGGGCGMYPLLLSNIFKAVYTFEPHPISFHCLVNNCAKGNIVKFNAALGDSHIMVANSLKFSSNFGENTVGEVNTNGTPQLMIDDLELYNCDFIQLDLEGYEIHALTGATQTIAKFRPVISVEAPRSIVSIDVFMQSMKYVMVAAVHADQYWMHKDVLIKK